MTTTRSAAATTVRDGARHRVLRRTIVGTVIAATALVPAAVAGAAPSLVEQGETICAAYWSSTRAVPPPVPTTSGGLTAYPATSLEAWLEAQAKVMTTTSKDFAKLKGTKGQRTALTRLSKGFSDLAAKTEALAGEYTTGTVTSEAFRTRFAAYGTDVKPIDTEIKAAAGELGFTTCVTPPSATATTTATTLAAVTRAPVASSGKAIDTSKIAPLSAPSFGMEFQRGLLGAATANASTSAQGWGVLPIWAATYPSVKFVGPTTAAVPGQVSASGPVKLGGKAKVEGATFAVRDATGCWAGLVWLKGKKFDTHELALPPSSCTADAALRYYEENGV